MVPLISAASCAENRSDDPMTEHLPLGLGSMAACRMDAQGSRVPAKVTPNQSSTQSLATAMARGPNRLAW